MLKRHGTIIERGNLTMLRRWRGTGFGRCRQSWRSQTRRRHEFVTETRNRYDAFGNVLVTLGPLAAIGADGEAHRYPRDISSAMRMTRCSRAAQFGKSSSRAHPTASRTHSSTTTVSDS